MHYISWTQSIKVRITGVTTALSEGAVATVVRRGYILERGRHISRAKRDNFFRAELFTSVFLFLLSFRNKLINNNENNDGDDENEGADAETFAKPCALCTTIACIVLPSTRQRPCTGAVRYIFNLMNNIKQCDRAAAAD